MKRNWKRKIIGGLCFTSVAFVFQACYGTMQDFGQDLFVEGHVKSKATGLPVRGIRVALENSVQYTNTDENGNFSFYVEKRQQAKFKFIDIDSTQNSLNQDKDTLIQLKESELSSEFFSLYLNIELENK